MKQYSRTSFKSLQNGIFGPNNKYKISKKHQLVVGLGVRVYMPEYLKQVLVRIIKNMIFFLIIKGPRMLQRQVDFVPLRDS